MATHAQTSPARTAPSRNVEALPFGAPGGDRYRGLFLVPTPPDREQVQEVIATHGTFTRLWENVRGLFEVEEGSTEEHS